MSKINKLRAEMGRRAVRAGGSHLTIEARLKTAATFARWCRATNRQLSEVSNRDGRDYLIYRVETCECSIATVKNEASHLRAMAPQFVFSNSELGIGHRNRTGRKKALSPDAYQTRASQIKDRGVRNMAELMRVAGLRINEALQCAKSLKSWKVTLRANGTIRVTRGTKGGRVRITEIPVAYRADMLRAIEQAQRIARANGGHLVVGKGGNLKSAKNKAENQMRQAGFRDEHSPHALRYGYAQVLEQQYRHEGIDRQEARVLTAESLGHGDSRGRYIASVYGT